MSYNLGEDLDFLSFRYQMAYNMAERSAHGQNKKVSAPAAVGRVAGGVLLEGARANVAKTSVKPPLDVHSLSFLANECTDEDLTFSPWSWVQAYPDHFIGKANKPRARPFFEKITENGVWDFFYICDPAKPDALRLLVPSFQFERFLSHINYTLGTALKVPAHERDRYFIKFGQGGTPRPRYLKQAYREKTLKLDVSPPRITEDVEAFRLARPADQAIMRDKLMIMGPAQASAAATKRQAKDRKQAQRKEDRRAMLYHAQQYLHLTGGCKMDVVFICMDVEAHEVAPRSVTEVGVSILDVSRTGGYGPGHNGHNWHRYIESHHLRVLEYAYHRNHRFVDGCPDKFNFGKSSFAHQANVAGWIETLLKPYTDQSRKLVFVGHDAGQDIEYLKTVGFDVESMKGLQEKCDTKDMHQAWKGLDNGDSLEKILRELLIDYKNLHNAGNDAAYTLQAMVGIANRDIRDKARA